MTPSKPLAPGDYARTVTLIDPMNRSDDGTDWPIHVMGGSRKMHQLDVLIDGDLIPGVKDVGLDFGPGEATIVTLHINPDLCDLAAPFHPNDGSSAPAGGIHGHATLTPAVSFGPKEECPWVYDIDTHTVACTMYAARVVFE